MAFWMAIAGAAMRKMQEKNAQNKAGSFWISTLGGAIQKKMQKTEAAEEQSKQEGVDPWSAFQKRQQIRSSDYGTVGPSGGNPYQQTFGDYGSRLDLSTRSTGYDDFMRKMQMKYRGGY